MIKIIKKWLERRVKVKFRNLCYIVIYLIFVVLFFVYVYSFFLWKFWGKGYVICVIFVELLVGMGLWKYCLINRLKIWLFNYWNF